MTKPNTYELGSAPEITIVFTDLEDVYFVPDKIRLSIERPDGVVITVSGAALTVASGYLSYVYEPPTIGWYSYYVWGEDNANREIAKLQGFEVSTEVL